MHRIQTNGVHHIYYDAKRSCYHIVVNTDDIILSSSILIEKRDKHGNILSSGVTLPDLEAIVNDIKNHASNKAYLKQEDAEQIVEVEKTEPDEELPEGINEWEIKQEQVIPDIPDVPVKKKLKDRLPSTNKGVVKKFKELCGVHSAEGFHNIRVTKEAESYFASLPMSAQKLVIMEYPQIKHKLDKHTRLDVDKIKARKKGLSKRQKDLQMMQET